MHEPDFWTSSADAMEQSIEGNRLIARELADLVRALWHRTARQIDSLLHGSGQHRSQPPV